MDLVELTPDFDITEFDCGDEQLNNFLFEDAKPSLALRVANTFILVDDGRVVAYFCLLNDKDSIKAMLHAEHGRSAFRFITVDAYLSAVPFYEKNGFLHLTKKDEDEHARLMYFDMMEIAD